MIINLFVNFYRDKNIKRRKEINYCFKQNANIKFINFYPIECQSRMRFNDYFDLISKVSNDDEYNIIANADIYFDETLLLIEGQDKKNVYALNRWNIINNKKQHYNELCSADVWIWHGVPKNVNGDFYLGWNGCDGRLGYEIENAGYNLYNPSLSIKSYHVHQTNIRNYNPYSNLVPGPYMGSPASTLNNMQKAVGREASLPNSSRKKR